MPGDISKHTKYIVKIPYPEPKVERKDAYVASLLMQDYAGAVSELTAITMYTYQHIMGEDKYKEYATVIGGVSMAEMKHLELLGETIKLLGVKPIYVNSPCMCGQPWNSCYVSYIDDIIGMLLEDIKAEKQAIEIYKQHMRCIKDKYIKNLIERIILDEQLHLKLFTEMYEKYKVS